MNKKEAILYAKICWSAYGGEIDLNDFELTAKFENKGTDTQGLLGVALANALVIAFRGTDVTGQDWVTNVRIVQQVYPYGNGDSKIKVHRGFLKAYESVREAVLKEAKKTSLEKIVCTGHSLGGALATLCAFDLQENVADKGLVCYTYGAPRVGDRHFASAYNQSVPHTFRFVNGDDIVPKLPRWWNGYVHVKQCYRIGHRRFTWKVVSRGIEDHYPHSYVEALQALP